MAKKIKIRQLERMISSVPTDGYQVLRFIRYFLIGVTAVISIL
jgi:hypothetical protein